MATETAEMKSREVLKLENELKDLKQEYEKLEKHLTEIELKYHSEISQIISSGENPSLLKLQRTVSRLYNQPLYSDIMIKLEDDQEIFGHKIILTARSENWGVDNFHLLTQLDLTGRRCHVAIALIKWVYTDEFEEINVELMIELIKMADEFDIEFLKLRCEKELVKLHTKSNRNQLLEISEMYSCLLLKQVCLQDINGTADKDEPEETEASTRISNDTVEDSPGRNNINESPGRDNESSDEESIKPVRRRIKKSTVKLKSTRIKSKIRQKLNSKKPAKPRRKTVDFSTPTKPRFQTSTLQCKDCHRKFTYKDSYDKHVKMHKGDNCVAEIKADVMKKLTQDKFFDGFSNLNDGETNFGLDSDLDLDKGSTDENAETKKFSCPVCPKSFPTPEKLKRHSEIHTRIRKHKCPEKGCDKSFFTNSTLKQHMLIHSNEKPYTCEVCQKPFRHSSALSVHLELHARQGQLEKTTFPCEECGLKLATTQSLQRHVLNKHTEGKIKPIFQCSICGEIFGYRGSLKAHTKKHNGEGFTQCDICGREFKDRKNLKSHLRTHSDLKPYECPHCNYTCKHSSAMLNHVRRHTGVRPHICDVCGKSFISASELKRHTLIHTGDKPFNCHLCGKAFRKSHHVKQHFKTHKNEGYMDPGDFAQTSNYQQTASFIPNTLPLPNLS